MSGVKGKGVRNKRIKTLVTNEGNMKELTCMTKVESQMTFYFM